MKFTKIGLMALALSAGSDIVDARPSGGGGVTKYTKVTTYVPPKTTVIHNNPSPVVHHYYNPGYSYYNTYYSGRPMTTSEIIGVVVGVIAFCAICICISAC